MESEIALRVFKNRLRTTRQVTVMAMVFLCAAGSYLLWGSQYPLNHLIPVEGFLLGSRIQTKVDHPMAQQMLSSPHDTQVQQFFDTWSDQPLNTLTLSRLSSEYSMDVATLYFLQRSYSDPGNRQAQDLYSHYNQQLKSSGTTADLALLSPYHVVFVPGLGYQQDPSTGADFARQRRLLSTAGISHELIYTDEWGLVRDNAVLVANRLRELNQREQRIIVVSASKGSLETALALGRILLPEETHLIGSWISVGGILRGSPLADLHLKAPRRWVTRIFLWLYGSDLRIVRDLSYQRRNDLFEQLRFPEDLTILHFVGVPLSSTVSNEIKRRYCQMRKLGPNDGLTPLADQLTPQGITISEIELDHYFRDPEIDRKTLALALVAISI